MSDRPVFRTARLDEAEALSELCLRSKAIHGYDAAFIEACRAELTVRPDRAEWLVVAEIDGVAAGLAELSIGDDIAVLEKLFVDPAFTGRDVGRDLFRRACQEAAIRGARVLSIGSDPGAAGFYRRMGAIECGVEESASFPGRFLPRFELALR